MAYATLMGKVADLGDAMVIDPYLRAEQLLSFLQFTTANRFLIGPNVARREVVAMQTLIQSQGGPCQRNCGWLTEGLA